MATIIRTGEDRTERDDRATGARWPRTYFFWANYKEALFMTIKRVLIAQHERALV
jgi:hypothetical protein